MVVVVFYHSAILCLTNNKWKIRKEKSFLTIQSSWKIKKHREQKIKQYQRRILKKKDFQLFFYLFWRIFLLLLGFLWVYSFFIIILYMRYNSEVKIFFMLVSSAWRIKIFKIFPTRNNAKERHCVLIIIK